MVKAISQAYAAERMRHYARAIINSPPSMRGEVAGALANKMLEEVGEWT